MCHQVMNFLIIALRYNINKLLPNKKSGMIKLRCQLICMIVNMCMALGLWGVVVGGG